MLPVLRMNANDANGDTKRTRGRKWSWFSFRDTRKEEVGVKMSEQIWNCNRCNGTRKSRKWWLRSSVSPAFASINALPTSERFYHRCNSANRPCSPLQAFSSSGAYIPGVSMGRPFPSTCNLVFLTPSLFGRSTPGLRVQVKCCVQTLRVRLAHDPFPSHSKAI